MLLSFFLFDESLKDCTESSDDSEFEEEFPLLSFITDCSLMKESVGGFKECLESEASIHLQIYDTFLHISTKVRYFLFER